MNPPVAPNAAIYHGGIGITVLDNFISEEEKTDALSLFGKWKSQPSALKTERAKR